MPDEAKITGEVSLTDFLNGEGGGEGTNNGENNSGEQPANNNAGGEPAKPAGEPNNTPAATETGKQGVENGEPAKPAEQPKGTETAPVVTDWKELIKKADRKEVLKEAGLDDFELDFIEYRKSGGDPRRYLEAATRDWNKVSDLDVIRQELRQEFNELAGPETDEETFALWEEKQLRNRFKIGEDFVDDKEKKLADMELKFQANKLRKKYSEEDKKFLIPEKKTDPQDKMLDEVTAQREAVKTFMSEHQATKNLITTKQIISGEGDEQVKFNIPNPEKLVDLASNPDRIFEAFQRPVMDAGGKEIGREFDPALLYKALAYALHEKEMEKTWIDHGKSLGIASEEKDLHNIPKENGVRAADGGKKESLNDAFSKRGKDIPYQG